MEIKETRYRLRHSNYKNWRIQEYKLQSKEKDTWKWVSIKYPGTLENAVSGLIALVLAEHDPMLNWSMSYPYNLLPEEAQNAKVVLNVDIKSLEAFVAILQRLESELKEILSV